MVWIDFPNLSQKDPSFGKLGHVINPLTPGAFYNKSVLDILVLFRLDVSLNLVENAFATQQLALLSMAFYNNLIRACAEIKILDEKVTNFQYVNHYTKKKEKEEKERL